MFFVSSDVKRTLVKVLLQQRDLLPVLKMNISLNDCKWVKIIAKQYCLRCFF